jgi:hypothetical protein
MAAVRDEWRLTNEPNGGGQLRRWMSCDHPASGNERLEDEETYTHHHRRLRVRSEHLRGDRKLREAARWPRRSAPRHLRRWLGRPRPSDGVLGAAGHFQRAAQLPHKGRPGGTAAPGVEHFRRAALDPAADGLAGRHGCWVASSPLIRHALRGAQLRRSLLPMSCLGQPEDKAPVVMSAISGASHVR